MDELKLKVFSLQQLSLATVFFGPFAGVYLLARNFRLLGDIFKAKRTLIFGYSLATLYLIGTVFIPDNVGHFLRYGLPWVPAGIIYQIAYYQQKQAIVGYGTSGSMKRYSAWKMLGVGLLSLLVSLFILFAAYAVVKLHILNPGQYKAQQAAEQKATFENNLTWYTSTSQHYALKLPKDFVLAGSDPQQRDILKSKEAASPFIVMIQPLPKEPSLVYVNDATTNDSLLSFDNALQKITGSANTTTVSGDINIPGTKHKRGIFATFQSADTSGRILSNHILIIPKDDGTSLLVNISMLKESEQQLEPLIDIVFKSINLQP